MQIPSCVPVMDSSLSDIVKEVLEEQVRPLLCCLVQFGSIMDDADGSGWTIKLPTKVEIHVTVDTWEVDCSNEEIKKAVEESISSVVNYM